MRQVLVLLNWLIPIGLVIVSVNAYVKARVSQQISPGMTALEMQRQQSASEGWFLLSNASFGAAIVSITVSFLLGRQQPSEKNQRGFPIR